MKKIYWGIVALAALPPTLATASQFHHVAGSVCGTSFNNGTLVSRGPGITNWGSSGIYVECPIDITPSTSVNAITVNPSTVRVDYVDGNPDTSSGDLSCRLMVQDSNFTIVTTPWQYSCANLAGGCTSGGTNSQGVGYVTVPDTIPSTANVVAVDVQCYIPYLPPGSGTTTLVGVALGTTTP